jgi:hypothetical protein
LWVQVREDHGLSAKDVLYRSISSRLRALFTMYAMCMSIIRRLRQFTLDIQAVIFRRIIQAGSLFTEQAGDIVHGEADVTIRVRVHGDSAWHTIPGMAGR